MGLEERVANAVAKRAKVNEPIWELIKEVKRNSELDTEKRDELLVSLFACLSDKDILETLANDALLYGAGTSFRSSMNSLQRHKQRLAALGVDLFPGQNPKLKDRDFAVSLGVPVPRTLFEDVSIDDIELLPHTVLKPVEGVASKGVFIITESLQLKSVRTARTYASINEARVEIEQHSASITMDRWLLEEAILDESNRPARDFKVFAFYGVSGMFLEIDRFSYSEKRFATYTESGRQIERGPNYVSFPGTGVPQGLRELSQTLSLAAPIPFLRLDFYLGKTGLYLGEITPRPGGTYSGDQYESVDRMLGEHYADAAARLYLDLLNGKRFPEFRRAYGVF